mmetsp:Transcript_61338/g.200564  ORF Transcript_61338/g.200564 Transcript_61338/m.200564 type:complete len:336 (-) Transcript_61338:310-1317(-)
MQRMTLLDSETMLSASCSLGRQLAGVLFGAHEAALLLVAAEVRAVGARVVIFAFVVAPIVDIARELLSPRCPPDEGQQAIEAEGSSEGQDLPHDPERIGVHLAIDCGLLLHDEGPHHDALQHAHSVVGVLGHRVVLTAPHKWLEAHEDQGDGHEETVGEVHRPVPGDDDDHDGVVDGKDPNQAIGVLDPGEERQCYCPGGDLEPPEHRHTHDVGTRRSELHLLLPHRQAQAHGQERGQHGGAEQRQGDGGRRAGACPEGEGVQLHERIGGSLEQGLQEPQRVEVVGLTPLEDAAVGLREDLHLRKVQEEALGPVATRVCHGPSGIATGPKGNVET